VRLPAGTARSRATASKAARPVRACPRCGSPNVNSDLNFLATPRYLCADCGFKTAFLITSADEAAVKDEKEGRA
jgi:transposase-like protein